MLSAEKIKKIVRGIIATRSDEIGCEECYHKVDQFVEMLVDGKPAAEAMPMVKNHLDLCGDCKEEFEALLEAIKVIST